MSWLPKAAAIGIRRARNGATKHNDNLPFGKQIRDNPLLHEDVPAACRQILPSPPVSCSPERRSIGVAMPTRIVLWRSRDKQSGSKLLSLVVALFSQHKMKWQESCGHVGMGIGDSVGLAMCMSHDSSDSSLR